MEIFTEDGVEQLLRWIHIAAGITWIGLLYYFNFVQGPSFAQFEAPARTEATRKLVPRALLWFRWAAFVTWAVGLAIFLVKIGQDFEWDWGTFFDSGYSVLILGGMILGTIMFLNVWGVIWPNQKIVIASADAAAAGGQADPRAAGSARRALLASRTNVVFSIPMLFFMVFGAHLPNLGNSDSKGVYWIIFAIIVVALQANALFATSGGTTKPLDKVGPTITTSVVLWIVLYAILEAVQT